MPSSFRHVFRWNKLGKKSRLFLLKGQPEGYPEETLLRHAADNHLSHMPELCQGEQIAVMRSMRDQKLIEPVPTSPETWPHWGRLTPLGEQTYKYGRLSTP